MTVSGEALNDRADSRRLYRTPSRQRKRALSLVPSYHTRTGIDTSRSPFAALIRM